MIDALKAFFSWYISSSLWLILLGLTVSPIIFWEVYKRLPKRKKNVRKTSNRSR